MAVAHIQYSSGATHAHLIRTPLGQLENGLNGLVALLGTMALMIDGDGSDPAHFTYAANKFGFPDGATAKAAWDELNSLKFKLTTNAAVSDVNAAMLQAFNKLR